MKMLKITKKYFSTTHEKVNIYARNFLFIVIFAHFSHIFDGYVIT